MHTHRFPAPTRRLLWLTVLSGLAILVFLVQHFRGETWSVLPWKSLKATTGSQFIFKGPNAQDKVVVMAKMADESVSWAFDNLDDWQLAIYHMEDPTYILHPPKNKGREAMAYLTFLIDHYHILPHVIVFLHAHQNGWPKAWHTDAKEYDNVNSVLSLRIPYVEEHGYANLRCLPKPGCPAEMHPFRNDSTKPAELEFADAWIHFFGGNMTAVPKEVGTPCCAQFAVTSQQVLKRERSEYIRYRQWLLDTELADDISGRVFEYMWHIIFGKPAVWCPRLEECWCEQFGRC